MSTLSSLCNLRLVPSNILIPMIDDTLTTLIMMIAMMMMTCLIESVTPIGKSGLLTFVQNKEQSEMLMIFNDASLRILLAAC